MMNGMMVGDGTIFGMGLFGLLVVIAMVLAIYCMKPLRGRESANG